MTTQIFFLHQRKLISDGEILSLSGERGRRRGCVHMNSWTSTRLGLVFVSRKGVWDFYTLTEQESGFSLTGLFGVNWDKVHPPEVTGQRSVDQNDSSDRTRDYRPVLQDELGVNYDHPGQRNPGLITVNTPCHNLNEIHSRYVMNPLLMNHSLYLLIPFST